MGCARGLCAADKIFIFINIAFAMYSGALLATAARLAWDPSTYTWFRFLCRAQYRVSAAYVLAAGLWLAALVYLAACAARTERQASQGKRIRSRPLHAYTVGVACLALSEVGYGAWMCASLAQWWRSAPEAELARRGIDLLHDLKPALLAIDRYRDVARPVLDMIEEVEREAPNNVFVIIIFGVIGMILQVAAIIMARRLARTSNTWGDVRASSLEVVDKEHALEHALDQQADGKDAGDGDSASGDCARGTHGWRKKANLRMYTILDKIF